MRDRLSLVLVLGTLLVTTPLYADVQHVVGKGHTIEAIANRYHVSAKSIMDANHLKDAKHLHVGDVLTIPKVDPPAGSKAKADAKDHGKDKDAKSAKLVKGGHAETPKYEMKAKTPGVVHIKRIATTEEADVRIAEKGNKVSPTTLKTFEKMLRSPTGMSHPIEARLISLLSVMSNHFGSRKIEVVSGFRPYTPTQYTQHSNHNHGKAVDFRVVGVPNEVVRDFCRTLKNTGCGYYPNSTFVHMDVREKEAFWIDYSKPGEAPRYNAANVEADEGTSDVHDDGKASDSATTETPPATTDAPAKVEAPATTEAPAKPDAPAN
jgi:uncharacterized protein YcbK (DUF882 family)